MYTVLMMSSCVFDPSGPRGSEVLNCPAGVKSMLPSGAKVRRLKKDVNVSLAYMLVFLTPMVMPPDKLGEAEGMTAGNGIDGLGETDRCLPRPACDPNDDRLLCEVGGGFMGARDCGVPGADGLGEPSVSARVSWTKEARDLPKSGGAGLLEETLRLPGRSIFATLLL